MAERHFTVVTVRRVVGYERIPPAGSLRPDIVRGIKIHCDRTWIHLFWDIAYVRHLLQAVLNQVRRYERKPKVIIHHLSYQDAVLVLDEALSGKKLIVQYEMMQLPSRYDAPDGTPCVLPHYRLYYIPDYSK